MLINYNVIALILRMHTAKGFIEEIFLHSRWAARIACPPALIPAPGQYLLATPLSEPLPVLAQPLFSAGVCLGGFYAAPPLPANWLPGAVLRLRGPLGHGFSLPPGARKVALAAPHGNSARLLALLEPALAQKASVALLSSQPPAGLPAALEILPSAALPEILPWADYLAIDLPRQHLPGMLSLLLQGEPQSKRLPPRAGRAQILVQTPLPCGGLANCGVCSVELPAAPGQRLACQDGPVFDIY